MESNGVSDENKEEEIVRRAALDVGSACIKLVVADVRCRPGSMPVVINSVFETQANVYMTEDLEKHGGTEFSSAILDKSFQALKQMQKVGKERGATEIAGIATAAFRKASNGPAHLERLREEGIKLEIVAQEEEAALGFMTARSACSDIDVDRMVAWDSGGGSFQVSTLEGGKVASWMAAVGSGVAASLLVQRVQGGCLAQDMSPNPVALQDAEALVTSLRSKLGECPPWLLRKISSPGVSLVGIGDAYSIFHLGAQLASEAAGEERESFSKSEVWEGVRRVCGKSDQELLDLGYTRKLERARSVIPKMVLLFTVMDILGAQEVVKRTTNGNGMGVLVAENFWTSSN